MEKQNSNGKPKLKTITQLSPEIQISNYGFSGGGSCGCGSCEISFENIGPLLNFVCL